MLRLTWLLKNHQPIISIQLRDFFGLPYERILLADTGAGPSNSPFDFVLSETDCQRFGILKPAFVGLGGAVRGIFPIYLMAIEIELKGYSLGIKFP